MKLIFALAAFLLSVLSGAAATPSGEPFLWPVEGVKAGEGVISCPQSYLGDELNFDNLFIGAAEGFGVVAPSDGVVESFGPYYLSSLSYMVGGGVDEGQTPAEALAEFRAGLSMKDDPKFASFKLCIRLADGRRIWLGGLMCDRVFRTGEKIRRGERVGTVSYAYKKISEPGISVGISTAAGNPADPQAPFGIRSTFVPPAEIPRITSLTAEQARADFNTLMDVLREAYPGLHDAVTPEELERYCSETLASIPDPIDIRSFYNVIKLTVAKLHDSHLALLPMESDRRVRSIRLPQIYFGWIDSTLVATRCTKPYAAYYGRRIRSVNGIAGDSLSRLAAEYIGGFDGRVASVREYYLTMSVWNIAGNVIPELKNCDFDFEFENGERLSTKGWDYTGRDGRGLAPDWRSFMMTNNHGKFNFGMKQLDDSTAYLGLSTFQFSQVEVDSVAAYLRSVAAKPNLIIDVRNNPGGDVKALSRILSFLTDKPFAALGGYSMVSKPGGIRSFADCCMNYTSESEIVGGYEPVEGREGFYSFEDNAPILPDSMTCYPGRIYVLIDQNSCSAATIFPATLLRNHRAVIVGRETATAYHFMNAHKFADIRLPNSWLSVRIPLVRCVFDTTENPRIPYGRGVIPDREIRLSLDEIAAVRGDSILDYTLAMISRGEYLGDDPFAVETPEPRRRVWWIVGAALLVLVGGVSVWRRLSRPEIG